MSKIKTLIIIICIASLLVNVVYFGLFENVWEKDGELQDDDDDDKPGPGPGDNDPIQQGDSTSEGIKLGETEEMVVGAVTHSVTITDIEGDEVTLIIESDPVEVTATLDIPEYVDTDKDDIYDIQVLITEISGTTVKLTLTSILLPINNTGDEELSVRQPPLHIGDDYRYDFTVFAELYSENKSSGEYERYTITGDGQWDFKVYGPVNAESGYGKIHSCVQERMVADGALTVIVDTTDSGKVTVDGSFSADRSEYTELAGGIQIKAVNSGTMSVDQLPRATVPVPIEYEGYVRTYSDPEEETLPTLEDQIYKDRALSVGDNGSVYYQGNYDGALDQGFYNWSAEDMENVEGIPSLRVNITRKYWGFLDYTQTIWLSSKTPYPTRTFLRTNTSWDSENHTGWIIIEQDRVLTSGYSRGSSPISWENSVGEFLERHPQGEYEDWDMIPKGGYMFENADLDEATNPDQSIQIAPDTALEYMVENSSAMGDFARQFPTSFVTKATYNATLSALDPQKTAGSHYWNITLSDYMSEKELEPYYEDYGEWQKENEGKDKDEVEDFQWPEHIYSARMAKNITKSINPLNPYSSVYEIDKDYGKLEGWARMKRSEMDDEGITLSGAVDIVSGDEMAGDELFDRNGDLDLSDSSITIARGVESSQLPAAQVLQQITGIVVPSARFGWIFWKGSAWEQGDMFSVAIDVETGRMVYVTKISGTALMGLFDEK